MSGRSAYVRKKNQDPTLSRSKSKSSSGSSRDSHSSASTGEYPYYPAPSAPIGTGIGTTNGRLLKFSDSTADIPLEAPDRRSTGWDGYYAQERRLRTEDVSGIEKSGLRSAIDRKSDDVRKGIARTLTFGKKGKDEKSKGKGREDVSMSSPEPSEGSGDMVAGDRGETDMFFGAAYREDEEGDCDPYGVPQPHPHHSQIPGRYHQEQHGTYQPPPQGQYQNMPPPQSPRSPRPGGGLHPWDASTPLPSPPPSRELPPLPLHKQPRRWRHESGVGELELSPVDGDEESRMMTRR